MRGCSWSFMVVHGREWTRRQGRPKTRRRANLIRHLGPARPRIAGERRRNFVVRVSGMSTVRVNVWVRVRVSNLLGSD